MLLQVKNVGFEYIPHKPVLKQITFNLDRGEFLGILGPNGTGKSTLLKCINHIYKVNDGEILLDNENTEKMTLNAIAKKIAYVPQYINTGFPVSVMNTVLMGRIPYSGRAFKEIDKEASLAALEKVHMMDYMLRDIRFLSGGEKQRVFVARALAGEPKIILMDEPTSSLDVKHQVEILGTVRTLVKETDISVMMTIHDLNLASMFCNRILILKDGCVWKDGNPKDILTSENATTIYGVHTFTFDKFDTRYINLLDKK